MVAIEQSGAYKAGADEKEGIPLSCIKAHKGDDPDKQPQHGRHYFHEGV